MLGEGETLINAAHLLEYTQRRVLMDYAVRSSVGDQRAIDFWQRLAFAKSGAEWDGQMLSTTNKLSPLVEYSGPRRFMGLNVEGLDIGKVMSEGAIVLVNLVHSKDLPMDVGKLFAAFLLHEFFTVARMRGDEKTPDVALNQFSLYLDEFQEYMTEDMSTMLDGVRKGGLHLVLAHQHMSHFVDHPKLKESVMVNARIRAVFGGLSTQSACELAEEMCLAELNERQVKKALYHTIHVYDEQTRTIHSDSETKSESNTESESDGSGSVDTEGWFETDDSEGDTVSTGESGGYAESEFSSSSSSQTIGRASQKGKSVVPVWVPIPKQELSSEQDWTLEEKRLKIAQMLKYQAERHCFVNLDQAGGTQPLCVPFIDAPTISAEMSAEYEKESCEKQGSIPAEEVDRFPLF